MAERDPRLARAGVSGYNKPKRTPNHPKKSHIVVAKEGEQVKTIRFGQQGVSTAGKKTDAKSNARRRVLYFRYYLRDHRSPQTDRRQARI